MSPQSESSLDRVIPKMSPGLIPASSAGFAINRSRKSKTRNIRRTSSIVMILVTALVHSLGVNNRVTGLRRRIPKFGLIRRGGWNRAINSRASASGPAAPIAKICTPKLANDLTSVGHAKMRRPVAAAASWRKSWFFASHRLRPAARR